MARRSDRTVAKLHAGGGPLVVGAAWGAGEVRPLEGGPRPWGDGEQVRVLATSGVGSSTSAVEVHLEHREHPGVRFTVALDADHEVCGVAIGGLRWRTRDYGGASVPEVDTSPAAGIRLTAADLRAVNWGQLQQVAQRAVRDHYGWLAEPGTRWGETVRRGDRRPGRRGWGDLFHAQMAAEYVALLDQGERFPNRVMAERRGESVKSVTEAISRCRHVHGMLTPAPTRGQPGGQLTDKARAVLAAEGE